ncbi:MAG TPA: hypothetical protein PK581_05470 [Caldisericia bacterium]|nr:hypothetical protein [Caldisericia bacterium]
MIWTLFLALVLFCFDYFYIAKPLFSISATGESKRILWNEISQHNLKAGLISKKKLNTLVFPSLIPQYLRHKLERKGIIYVLRIDESTQLIPIELNHQLWYVHTNGEIITGSQTSQANLDSTGSAREALFSIQINTSIDQIEAYRKYIQEFVRFLLNSENSIGPSIKVISYNESLGLSFVDYRDVHFILGKKSDYSKINNHIKVLSDPKIQQKLKQSAYNEIDFRFEKKIICRFHSKNP